MFDSYFLMLAELLDKIGELMGIPPKEYRKCMEDCHCKCSKPKDET